MSTSLSWAERTALVQIARMFYLEDLSKVEIAQQLGISRFKVARRLEQARQEGIVTIALQPHGTLDPGLSQALTNRLGLTEAVVVATSGEDEERRDQVASAAAEVLRDTLHDGEVLGMSWGRTLSRMTEDLTTLPVVSVVQLTGTVGGSLDQSPVEIIRRVATATGGSAHPVFAPMIVGDRATAAALRQQPDVAAAMALFSEVTTALLSLGSWDPLDSQLGSALPDERRAELLARGVVAEFASTLIARDGSLLAPDFAGQSIAIQADELRRIPRVLVVAAGSRKVGAMRALLRAGLVTGVITDAEIARALLADEDLLARGTARP
ncbi:MAG: sugar-binding transcriptional regulator [Propioniciclava sp.]